MTVVQWVAEGKGVVIERHVLARYRIVSSALQTLDKVSSLLSIVLQIVPYTIMQLFSIALLCSLVALASAQFQFFEQMFNQGGQQQHHQHQQQQQQQNVPSNSDWYQKNYEAGKLSTSTNYRISWTSLADELAAQCSNYLCPGTLACVHFPHHCPCPFPSVEDKVELGDGSAICVSKGGWKEGEAARKIELARKGML